jgi:hypothetical protein
MAVLHLMENTNGVFKGMAHEPGIMGDSIASVYEQNEITIAENSAC